MSPAHPSSTQDQDDPIHAAARVILEMADGQDADALAESLSRKHAIMASEISDLRQKLFEKTCELAEVKSRKETPEAHNVAPEQISEWFKNGPGETSLPISAHAELQNFRDLSPSYLIRLAQSSKLSQMLWKEEMRKKPWKIGLWRALKRYERRVR